MTPRLQALCHRRKPPRWRNHIYGDPWGSSGIQMTEALTIPRPVVRWQTAVVRNITRQTARIKSFVLAKLPPLTTRYTRIALTQKLRRIVDEGIGYGLALEGISAADVARRTTP